MKGRVGIVRRYNSFLKTIQKFASVKLLSSQFLPKKNPYIPVERGSSRYPDLSTPSKRDVNGDDVVALSMPK